MAGETRSRGVARLERWLEGKDVDWLGPRPAARCAGRAFGPASLLRVRVSPLRIGQPHAGAEPGRLHLIAHLLGRGRYRHRRGALEVRPGALVLVAEGETCEVTHDEGAAVVAWKVTAGTVTPFLPAGRRLGPVAAADGAIAGIAAAHAGTLAATAEAVADAAAARLVDHLGVLTGLAFAEARGGGPARASHRALSRRRIAALIEARFRDPELTATAAARSLGMSRRWLAALMAEEGAGFTARLAERRLAAARALLDDPAADGRSITEIAFACGFGDLSTFHRRFRARYGLTPGRARADRRLSAGRAPRGAAAAARSAG